MTQGQASQRQSKTEPPRPPLRATPGQQSAGAREQAPSQQTTAPADQSVSTPALQWVRVTDRAETVPLGEDDYVLGSQFDPTTNCWDVLVLLRPRDEESEEDD